MNIDATSGGSRPVHTLLLGADIPIVEHLCHLDQLPDDGFTFTAAPPLFRGIGSLPGRRTGRPVARSLPPRTVAIVVGFPVTFPLLDRGEFPRLGPALHGTLQVL